MLLVKLKETKWLSYEGRNSFSHSAARSYCAQRGMRIVSLDSRDKAEHFMRQVSARHLYNADTDALACLQVAADGSPYFWAGGRISSDKRTLSWENGRSEGIRKGQVTLLWQRSGSSSYICHVVQHPWSFTGSRGAQPDGGRGSENCLAILNNFYNVSPTIFPVINYINAPDFDTFGELSKKIKKERWGVKIGAQAIGWVSAAVNSLLPSERCLHAVDSSNVWLRRIW